ncbi:hypothetical protein ACFFX0_19870 [Citricoccus parietis]|uniref:Uncharacterized protein n=1 Tax=Citricoccus parietis TaxID=592307 RepID=A0ABV5G330_9MICC
MFGPGGDPPAEGVGGGGAAQGAAPEQEDGPDQRQGGDPVHHGASLGASLV